MLESLISTIWSACKARWYPPTLSFGCEGYQNSGHVGSGFQRAGSGRVSRDVFLDRFPKTSGCEVDPDSWSSKSFWL